MDEKHCKGRRKSIDRGDPRSFVVPVNGSSTVIIMMMIAGKL